MDEREVILDLLRVHGSGLRAEVRACEPEELHWRPDGTGNSVALTVWHVSRWFDVLATQGLLGEPAAEERWHASGWATRTGYDPRGIGYGGLGAITGYSPAEVDAVPTLGATDLLAYFQEAHASLVEAILETKPRRFATKEIPLFDGATAYEAVRTVLLGALGHLGEIQALRATWRRRAGNAAGEPTDAWPSSNGSSSSRQRGRGAPSARG